jgi:predicted 2-oxoglutarate/Fe(II)-dependent dioxygenase YbiX
MKVEALGAGVFVIRQFLSEDECGAHIARSEHLPFVQAGVQTRYGEQLHQHIRNNDRAVDDNPALAAALFERARPLLPPSIDGWVLSGFNQRFRWYRYEHEQFFKPHLDGVIQLSESEMSFLTFLIYLNDDFSGGSTDFIWERVQPETGMALVFPHRIRHQGSVVTSGVKYVLRTDVMYRRNAE